MPAVFKPGFFLLLERAIYDVGRGIRKVTGEGYSVYRVGPTIVCNLNPAWVDTPWPKEAPEGKEPALQGKTEEEWGDDL